MQSFQINVYVLLGVLETLLVALLAAAFLLWRNRRGQRRIRLLEAALREYRRQADTPSTGDDAQAGEPEDAVEEEAEDEAQDVGVAAAEPEPGPEADPPRATVDTRDQEFCRLKEVIHNQHDAMRALRAELEARQADSADSDQAAALLDEYEKQGRELENCVQVLEAENARLRSQQAAATEEDVADASGAADVKALIDAQQDTIEGLRTLVAELEPDEARADELAAALDAIQRGNGELARCVGVLEDENRALRLELEQVRQQLAAGDTEAVDIDVAVAAPPADTGTGGHKKAG